MTVTRPNHGPIAVDDKVTVNKGGKINIAVHTNDTDADGDALKVIEVSQGANSDRVVLNGDGTVHYRPAADFVGTDQFTYTISDGYGGTASAQVTVTVSQSNQVSVETDDVADTDTEMPETASVLENDSDTDTVTRANRSPRAVDDEVTVSKEGSINIAVLTNDTDADGDAK